MLKRLKVEKNLHILIIEDKNKHIFMAHCLDMDIVSQGKTKAAAVHELIELIQTQMEYCLENDMLDTMFRPAPKEYWDKYYQAQAASFLKAFSALRSLHDKAKGAIKDLTSHLELAYAPG